MTFRKFLLLPITVIIICSSAKAQADIATDSLLNQMCSTLSKNKGEPDSVRFFKAYMKHLESYLMKMNETEQEKLFDFVYFRLQRNCKEFFDMVSKDVEQKGDWESLDKRPVSSLDKATCNDFNSRSKYYYREANGDTVKVVVEKGLWQEQFIDGTYSKLNFRWVGDCEFELEFISSNHHIRKNLSKKGDKYRYQLLQKVSNYYSASAVVVGMEDYSKFKIYY